MGLSLVRSGLRWVQRDQQRVLSYASSMGRDLYRTFLLADNGLAASLLEQQAAFLALWTETSWCRCCERQKHFENDSLRVLNDHAFELNGSRRGSPSALLL